MVAGHPRGVSRRQPAHCTGRTSRHGAPRHQSARGSCGDGVRGVRALDFADASAAPVGRRGAAAGVTGASAAAQVRGGRCAAWRAANGARSSVPRRGLARASRHCSTRARDTVTFPWASAPTRNWRRYFARVRSHGG